MTRWTEYIGDLFEDDRPEKPSPKNLTGPPILKAETEHALKKVKKGKAPGPDGITCEMITPLEDFGSEKLTDMYNDMYDTGHLHDDFITSVFITLPKKPKANVCSDFRTISLMSHILKIFLTIILERIKKKLNEEVGEEQFGFRAKRGTRDAILCFNLLAQKQMQVQKDLYTCFIDYAKAFDRVHHKELIETLEKAGIDGKDIRIICELYWNQKAAIRIDQELSDPANIQRGVRQGCILSPYLFNIYTEYIFRKSQEIEGIIVSGRNINNIRYADDTALVADSNDKLQEIVNKVKQESDEKGLNMNVNKTKTMVTSKTEGKEAHINVEGKELEQVKTFKYLGQIIDQNGKCEEEIRQRIAKAKSTFLRMKNIFFSRNITMHLKLKLVKCYIMPIMSYAAETWTMYKTMENKIEAFEMWIFRRLGRISWKDKITNEEVMRRLSVKREILSNMRTAKLKYFGHTMRQESLHKTILVGRIEGKRARGRQRKIWTDDIKSWTGKSLTACMRTTQDRAAWRIMARRPLEVPLTAGRRDDT